MSSRVRATLHHDFQAGQALGQAICNENDVSRSELVHDNSTLFSRYNFLRYKCTKLSGLS